MRKSKKPILVPLILGIWKKVVTIIEQNIWFSIIMLSTIVVTFALIYRFENPNSLGIVNYAFAIVGAMSGICFSWARNFNDKNEQERLKQNRITELGEILLLSGIIFMFSSAIAYLGIVGVEYAIDHPWINKVIFISSLFVYSLRIIAFFMFCITTFEVCEVVLINILSRDFSNKYIDRSKND